MFYGNILLFFSRNFFLLTLLPHFHPLPASLYPSAFAPLWKHPPKVEANFASTYSKRHGFYCNSLIFILITSNKFYKTLTPVSPYFYTHPTHKICNTSPLSSSKSTTASSSPQHKKLPRSFHSPSTFHYLCPHDEKRSPTSYCLCPCTAASPTPCPTSGRMKCKPVAGW